MRFFGAFAIMTVAATLAISVYVLVVLLVAGLDLATLQLATVALVAGLAMSCLLALWYLLAGNRPTSTMGRSRGF